MKKCPSDPQIAISEQESIKNAMTFNEDEKCFKTTFFRSTVCVLRISEIRQPLFEQRQIKE